MAAIDDLLQRLLPLLNQISSSAFFVQQGQMEKARRVEDELNRWLAKNRGILPESVTARVSRLSSRIADWMMSMGANATPAALARGERASFAEVTRVLEAHKATLARELDAKEEMLRVRVGRSINVPAAWDLRSRFGGPDASCNLPREVYAVNPNADEVEGDCSYHDLKSIPGGVDAVVIGTRPEIAEDAMREAVDLGIERVWMHRGPGPGSVSGAATEYGRQHGVTVIDGGCPLMFPPTADVGHKVMRFVFTRTGKVPRTV